MEDEEYYEEEYKNPLEEWNERGGQYAGICPSCGGKIYQSTYADYCFCGDQDYAY